MQSLTVAESDQEVKFDQESSITDVKNTLMGEVRSVGGSNNVSKESPMSVSTANAVFEKSVREMQSTSSMVCGTVLNPGSASSTWTAEIVGDVVIRSQSSVSDGKTAWERRMRKSCRKTLVKFDELVMLMTIEKPRHQPYANTIILNLVDRSDEVVPMTDRVVKARIVYRVPKEQRDHVTNREEQQTSAEIAEGEVVNAAYVASVRSTGKVMELRETKLVGSVSSEEWSSWGCRVAALGDEASSLMVRSAESASEWRRGPAKTAYGGGTTRASSIGRKS